MAEATVAVGDNLYIVDSLDISIVIDAGGARITAAATTEEGRILFERSTVVPKFTVEALSEVTDCVHEWIQEHAA